MAIKITKEAEAQKAIYFKHCNRCGCEFEFSIDNDSIARDLMRLQKTGHKVAITFKEFDTTLPWRGKSKRVVTTFEER